MNLNDFHKHVSRKIYERGEEYYEDDMIDNVEHDYPDTWTAEVEGNDLYSVDIKLNGYEIVNTFLAHFKSVYSNRRAMMEGLGK